MYNLLQGGKMYNREKKRSIEKLALFGAVLLTAGLLIASIRFEQHINKQKAMFYELQLLRTSVQLFKSINQRSPESIKELIETEYKFPNEERKRKYLEYVPPMSEEGDVLDPFEHAYAYDVKTAWVRSSSKGHEFW